MYSYITNMIQDVETAIKENYTETDYQDIESFVDTLNDDLWTDDNVTGNASGSYTMNRAMARANILGDPEAMDYLNEAVNEYCIPSEIIAEKFLAEDWEYFDVTIRCYLLPAAITAAVDNLLVK